jgi:hypothetical protein
MRKSKLPLVHAGGLVAAVPIIGGLVNAGPQHNDLKSLPMLGAD